MVTPYRIRKNGNSLINKLSQLALQTKVMRKAFTNPGQEEMQNIHITVPGVKPAEISNQ